MKSKQISTKENGRKYMIVERELLEEVLAEVIALKKMVVKNRCDGGEGSWG